MRNSITLLSIILLLLGCKKEPGIGGNGTIQGSIITHHYNASFTHLIGTYPSADHYVYIVYGDHSGYDKRIKTDYNGEYQFEYLYPGNYTIYTYSLDSTGTLLSGQVVLKQEMELKKNEVKKVNRFVIYE